MCCVLLGKGLMLMLKRDAFFTVGATFCSVVLLINSLAWQNNLFE